MPPFDLREFAELRYRDGEPFGLAILELLDLEPEAERGRELLKTLTEATDKLFPDGEEWRHVEFLKDKKTLLDEIDTALKTAGFETGDIDDRVTDFLAKLEDVKTERDALLKEVEELRAAKCCLFCSGDCGAANPPVLNCPMRPEPLEYDL